jgi:hypothetical protein
VYGHTVSDRPKFGQPPLDGLAQCWRALGLRGLADRFLQPGRQGLHGLDFPLGPRRGGQFGPHLRLLGPIGLPQGVGSPPRRLKFVVVFVILVCSHDCAPL